MKRGQKVRQTSLEISSEVWEKQALIYSGTPQTVKEKYFADGVPEGAGKVLEAGKNNFSRFSLSTMPKGKKELDFSHFFKFYLLLLFSSLLAAPFSQFLEARPQASSPLQLIPFSQAKLFQGCSHLIKVTQSSLPNSSFPIRAPHQLYNEEGILSLFSSVQQGRNSQTASQPPKWTFQLK